MSEERKNWLTEMARLEYIRPEDIPDIELYMDQVTTFMESQLAGSKRTKEDKIMTKTMINNYTKNKLLPPPERKKYSKDHMYMLIFIYYFKSIMTIADIREILTPMSKSFFGSKKDKEIGLSEIYESIFQMEHEYTATLKENVEHVKKMADQSFLHIKGEEGEFLRKLSYITILCYDIYVKKQMIETLIDEMK